MRKPLSPGEKLKRQWLRALRSGKYKQGKLALSYSSDDGSQTFCCLGVLADVVDPTAWAPVEDRAAIRWRSHVSTPSLLDDVTEQRLYWLNDRSCRSFDEIADWIEEHIPPEDFDSVA